jgi:hypothetical protein
MRERSKVAANISYCKGHKRFLDDLSRFIGRLPLGVVWIVRYITILIIIINPIFDK